MKVEGLRSPYHKTSGLYHLARMLDKIRLHQAGQLPAGSHPNLGLHAGLDGHLCGFLGIEHAKFSSACGWGVAMTKLPTGVSNKVCGQTRCRHVSGMNLRVSSAGTIWLGDSWNKPNARMASVIAQTLSPRLISSISAKAVSA